VNTDTEKKRKHKEIAVYTLAAALAVVLFVGFGNRNATKQNSKIHVSQASVSQAFNSFDTLYNIVFFKGWHYPIPLTEIAFPQVFSLTHDSLRLDGEVLFHDNAAYIINDEDQWDWNKLCGISLGFNGIHKNSFRFGWRYNPQSEKIELSSYLYTNSNRQFKKVDEIMLNELARLSVIISSNNNDITINMFINDSLCDNQVYKITSANDRDYIMAYQSGLYFGGNKPAPQIIDIDFRMEMTNLLYE